VFTTLLAGLALLQAASPRPPVLFEYDVRIKMRDGATLSADIYRPNTTDRVPIILLRTPYDNGVAAQVAAGQLWAARGYAYVVQDVRGRGESEGTFYPLVTEAADGYDTIEWLAKQPWSNGRVGMMGGSYLGWVQTYAATLQPPSLKALIPTVTPPDPDRNFPFQFGVYGPTTISWLAATSGKTMQDISQHDLIGAYTHLPLYDADLLLGRKLTVWRDWLDHPTRDDYWKAQSYQAALTKAAIPMFHISGWYDDVLVGTTENYVNLTAAGVDPAVKANQFLLVGPWGHHVNWKRKLGAIDFGPQALVNLDSLQLRWFDRWLKEIDNGAERDPKVRIFVMNANRWRDENEWPLARTRYVRFYLHSRGAANGSAGDGRLDDQPPGSQPPDRFRADPMDPVPFITDAAFNQVGGPDDYRPVERRKDVLVYTSKPLGAPMEVCGPLQVKLFAASSAKDADWATKVIAVRPDGFALRLNDGIVRARFRHGMDKEVPLDAGEIFGYQIDNWSTCIRLDRGWRIRLEVASHAFPKFDRNLQTGGPIGKESTAVVADQTVYHDKDHASYLLLPVVPPR
jgi:putative CocE/NonD family hydrolase